MSTLVLTVDQPYASLIAAGVKRWVTQPSPPNGDMRPAGVRGLPGCSVKGRQGVWRWDGAER